MKVEEAVQLQEEDVEGHHEEEVDDCHEIQQDWQATQGWTECLPEHLLQCH